MPDDAFLQSMKETAGELREQYRKAGVKVYR